MRNWEEKYEKLKNGDFDARIDELKTKIDEKKATREEYKEYQKLEKSKGNVHKVKNVIEFREKLEMEFSDIQTELKSRQNLEKAEQEAAEINLELMQIENEFESIDKELKDKDLTPEKKSELENRKNELKTKRDKNNSKFLENQDALKSGLNRNEKFKNYSKEELEELKNDTKAKISKCNMVANKLVNGFSWDSIDLKLSNWNKLTNKNGKLSKKDKGKEERGSEIEGPEVRSEIPEGEGPEVETGYGEEHIEESPSRLQKIANWFKEKGENLKENHPLLAKISNGIGKLFKKDTMLPEVKPETKPETTKKIDSDKTFNEYIKFVAEYGEKDAKREQIKANERLMRRREEIQKANREEEAEKYGARYEVDDGSR